MFEKLLDDFLEYEATHERDEKTHQMFDGSMAYCGVYELNLEGVAWLLALCTTARKRGNLALAKTVRDCLVEIVYS